MRTKLLAAALGIGMAFTTFTAHAMRPEGLGNTPMICGHLWDEAKVRIDEYKDTTDERRGVLLNELRNIGTEWDVGCRFDYPNPEHRT